MFQDVVSYPRLATKRLLEDPNTFSTTMIVVLTDFYGTEFLNWSPETIRLETEDDFGVKWPATNFDRLMAGIAVITTDRFFKSAPDFITICNILSGAPATPGVFDPADAGECAWGITEAFLLSPPEDNDPFSPEVAGYVKEVVKMEGIITPPPILRIGSFTDKKNMVDASFSDDPEMYAAIWEAEKSKTDDINQMIMARLTSLIAQLSMLNLKNGDTKELTKKLMTSLRINGKDISR